MQTRTAYPTDTVTGGCFISGDYSTDEPIVDLDIYIDALPPFGRLCVSAKAVRMLVATMGWQLMSEDVLVGLDEANDDNRRLAAENRRLRNALSNIIEAAALCELVQVAELASDFPALQEVAS